MRTGVTAEKGACQTSFTKTSHNTFISNNNKHLGWLVKLITIYLAEEGKDSVMGEITTHAPGLSH